MCIKIRAAKLITLMKGLRQKDGGVGVRPMALIPVRRRIDGAGEIEERGVHRPGPIQRCEPATAADRPGSRGGRLTYEFQPDHFRCLLLGRRRIREAET